MRFSASERTEIERGAAWLAHASGRDVGTVAFDYDVRGGDPLPNTIRRERGPGDNTGACLGSTVYLDADDAEGGRLLAALAAHELGHCALGLPDDNQTDGIMRRLEPMSWTAREEAHCLESPTCASDTAAAASGSE